jgi:hypothetical protein
MKTERRGNMDMTINPPLRLKLRTARLLTLVVLAAMPIGYLGGAIRMAAPGCPLPCCG